MKRCGMCGRDLEASAFGANRSKPDGLQSCCRDCMRRIRAFSRTPRELSERRAERDFNRMMAVAREDFATVHIAGVGDVRVKLPPMEGR